MIPKSFSTSVAAQRRGRLVHDDQPRAHRERARDLDHLLLGDVRSRTSAMGLTFEPDALRDGARLSRHLAPVHETGRARLAADEDVLGDRHVRGEREFLVDRDDAERAAHRAGCVNATALAVKLDRAAIRPLGAGQGS